MQVRPMVRARPAQGAPVATDSYARRGCRLTPAHGLAGQTGGSQPPTRTSMRSSQPSDSMANRAANPGRAPDSTAPAVGASRAELPPARTRPATRVTQGAPSARPVDNGQGTSGTPPLQHEIDQGAKPATGTDGRAPSIRWWPRPIVTCKRARWTPICAPRRAWMPNNARSCWSGPRADLTAWRRCPLPRPTAAQAARCSRVA